MNFSDGLRASGNIVQATPQCLFDRLNAVFRFSLDVCALPENAKCESFFTPEIDGLKQEWSGGYGAIPHMAERFLHGLRKPAQRSHRAIVIS